VRKPRSFLERHEPAPFVKTREGRRVFALFILLALIGVIVARNQGRAPAAVEKAFARTEPQLTAEELAEKARQLAERRESFSVLFEGALRDSENGSDFAETPGYFKLADLLESYTPEDVSSRAQGFLDVAEVMKEPDLYRGTFVRVRGVVAVIYTQKLHPLASDRGDVVRGVITQPDGVSGAVAFDLFARPPGELDKHKTVVDIEGVLYRTVRYEREMKPVGWEVQVHRQPVDAPVEWRVVVADATGGIVAQRVHPAATHKDEEGQAFAEQLVIETMGNQYLWDWGGAWTSVPPTALVRRLSVTGHFGEVPWVLARSMRESVLPRSPLTAFLADNAAYLIGAMGVGAVVFWFYLQRAARQRPKRGPPAPKTIREMFEAKLREERPGGGATPTDVPP
jgi:hypothetical protein